MRIWEPVHGMVTYALSLAAKHYGKTGNAYAPLQFVDDFLDGQMVFDQRGKFVNCTSKIARKSKCPHSKGISGSRKLLAAYPMVAKNGRWTGSSCSVRSRHFHHWHVENLFYKLPELHPASHGRRRS